MQWLRMAGGLATVVLLVANGRVEGASADPIGATQEKADKAAKLEGRWNVVSGTIDGDEQDFQGAKVHIAEGKMTLKEENGDEQTSTYKADTSKDPGHIDVTPKQGKDQDKVFKGILIFEGSQVKLCLARPGDDRPTEASSKDGSGHILLVLEPAKSAP